MKRKKLKLEIWKSDDNKEEHHIFLADEPNTYVLGYNPELFNECDIMDLLLSYGYKF